MKTKKGWDKSNLDLDKYLGEAPCEINEELFMYILECVPPQYSCCDTNCIQGGDAIETIGYDDDGEPIYTFTTCKQIGDRFYYLGECPEFRQ